MVEGEQKGITDCLGTCGSYLTKQWGKMPTSFWSGAFTGGSLDMADEAARIEFGKGYCCEGTFSGHATVVP